MLKEGKPCSGSPRAPRSKEEEPGDAEGAGGTPGCVGQDWKALC